MPDPFNGDISLGENWPSITANDLWNGNSSVNIYNTVNMNSFPILAAREISTVQMVRYFLKCFSRGFPILYTPILKKLREHIAFGLSICPAIPDANLVSWRLTDGKTETCMTKSPTLLYILISKQSSFIILLM